MRPAPAAILIAAAVSVSSQQPKIGYDDTPMQPNGKWHIHDGTRPQPKMVTPGATPGAAPADATVLLGSGTDASAWKMAAGGAAVTWPMKDGVLQSAQGHDRNQGRSSPTSSSTSSSRRRRK